MQYTRESAIERLLKNYGPYYNIHMIEDDQTPITARCDFFEHSGQYVISKKAELWSAENEEFLYLLNIPHLTLPLFEQWRDYIHEDGMKRIHVGPGHMASYITAVFVCDTCDEDALKALKKCRIYKSFHFSSSHAMKNENFCKYGTEKMPYLQKFSFFIAWLDEFSCSAGACGRLPY